MRFLGIGPEKQMGPALLPTPLSPMRGQIRRYELGIRCFAIILHRSASFRVCHRRSHRHPDPPSGGFLKGDRGRSRLFPCIPHPRQAAPRSNLHAGPSSGGTPSGPKTFRNAPSGAGRTIRPMNVITSHFRQCRRRSKPKLFALVPRDVCGQIPPRLSGLNLSRHFKP